jgi:hypothetical protein
MARITEALLKDQNRFLSINDITPGEYSDQFKGSLFCTTTHCPAQLSYVYRENNRSHFRTWRESKHLEQCIHYFEKVNERASNRRNGIIEGTVTSAQIKRSLQEAFENEMMSDRERDLKRQKDRENRARRQRERVVKRETQSPDIRGVTDPNRINDDTNSIGTRLYKKDADALKEKDIGETRTVTGKLKNITYSESSAVIKIEKNNKIVLVKFEEVFFAINPQYSGLFHHIERFLSENKNTILNATGEVRINKRNKQYELAIFDGVGFLIQGRTIQSLASEYAMRDIENP